MMRVPLIMSSSGTMMRTDHSIRDDARDELIKPDNDEICITNKTQYRRCVFCEIIYLPLD